MKNSDSATATRNKTLAGRIAHPYRMLRDRLLASKFGPLQGLRQVIAPSRISDSELRASPITDNNFFPSGMSDNYRNRYDYDRVKIQEECLRAWRINPLARRIVNLISQFVVGAGVSMECDHKATQKFIDEWFNHPLNRLPSQLKAWKDEGTRTGNLFFLFSVDKITGMSFVRAVPADMIQEIQTSDNDVMQETYYTRTTINESPWPAYDPNAEQEQFMVHFADNRPVGTSWGEPDMAPMLPWIGRFSTWLEDRARLNHFRNSIMYILRLKGSIPKGEKDRRTEELNANPPRPGSVLVTDEGEDWGILTPQLDAFDASLDGLALKRMVAAGIGFPLHWLAEPEGSTRTTAEAAGTPSFKTLTDMQNTFLDMLVSLTKIAVHVRKRYDHRVKPDAEIYARGADITERDNANLALAASRIMPVVSELFDRGGIDEGEFLRLVYRMAGEVYETDEGEEVPTMLKAPIGARHGVPIPSGQPGGSAPSADPNAPDPNAQPDPEPEP